MFTQQDEQAIIVVDSNRGKGFRRTKRRRKYASGKKARAICDRSGFEHAYKDMVVEPGTGLLVYNKWSDGKWNKVDHPQNFPADVGEAIGLKNPRTDVPEPQILLTDSSGNVITDSKGLFYFIETSANILGETYVSGA